MSNEAKEWQEKARGAFNDFLNRPGPSMNHLDALKYATGLAGIQTLKFAEMSIGDCKKLISILDNLNIIQGVPGAVAKSVAQIEEEPKATGPSYGRILDI